MSLQRWLTDRVAIERPPTTHLPSGEKPEPVVVAEGVPCRIRGAVQSDLAHFPPDVVAVGHYMARFDAAAETLPQPNDWLRRQNDGLRVRVIGFADPIGDPGHAMYHAAVPCVRVG